MDLTPSNLARRILRGVQGFSFGEVKLSPSPIQPGDIVIGAYSNEPFGSSSIVVVTETGLIISEAGKSRRAQFADMRYVRLAEEKNALDSINVGMTTGDMVIVPIMGKYGTTKDVFEFSRFLSRVVALNPASD